MKIRKAKLADLGRVIEIERTSFGPDSYGLTTFLAHVFRDRKGFFVAEESEGGIMGFALVRLNLSWLGRRRGGVTSIAVAPEHRRRGIGRALMGEALAYLRKRHVEEADLEVSVSNRAAQSLYEAAGFRRSEFLPHYYGPERHGLRMVLDVKALEAAGDVAASAPAGWRGAPRGLGKGRIGRAHDG